MDADPAQLAPTGVVAGLSIDDGLLRVAVVERGEVPAVVDGAEADLDPRAVQGGRVLDRAMLGRRIAELWDALSLSGVPTFIGFQPDDAQVRTVLVRDWPDRGWPAEVLRIVELVRGRYEDEPVWNGAPLWRDQAVAARVAACRRPDVSALVSAARHGGVWVAGVELTGLALERAMQRVAPPFTLVVDRTGAGPATLLLLDHGVVVLGWRSALAPEVDGAGELRVYLLDEGTAVGMAQGALIAEQWLLAPPPLSWRTAVLLQPGTGLAVQSAPPTAPFAAALGLALGAAGVGARPVELQAPLLHSSLGLLQDLSSRPRAAGVTAASEPAGGDGAAIEASTAQPAAVPSPAARGDEEGGEAAGAQPHPQEPVVDLDDLADLVEAAVAATAAAAAVGQVVDAGQVVGVGDVGDVEDGEDPERLSEPPHEAEDGSDDGPGDDAIAEVAAEGAVVAVEPAAEPQEPSSTEPGDARAWPPPEGPPLGPGPASPSPSPSFGVAGDDESFVEALRAAWGARPSVRPRDPAGSGSSMAVPPADRPAPRGGRDGSGPAGGAGADGATGSAGAVVEQQPGSPGSTAGGSAPGGSAAGGSAAQGSTGDGSTALGSTADGSTTRDSMERAQAQAPAGAVATVVARPVTSRSTAPLVVPDELDAPTGPDEGPCVVPQPIAPPAPAAERLAGSGAAPGGPDAGGRGRRSRRRTRRMVVIALAAGVGAFVVARSAGNDPQVEPRPADELQTGSTAGTGLDPSTDSAVRDAGPGEATTVDTVTQRPDEGGADLPVEGTTVPPS